MKCGSSNPELESGGKTGRDDVRPVTHTQEPEPRGIQGIWAHEDTYTRGDREGKPYRKEGKKSSV